MSDAEFLRYAKIVETFSKKELTEKDVLETVKILEILILIDEKDPSRGPPQYLLQSYRQFYNIYHQAIKILKKKLKSADQKKLDEIYEIFANKRQG